MESMRDCKPDGVRYVVVLTKADKRGAKIPATLMEVRARGKREASVSAMGSTGGSRICIGSTSILIISLLP